MKFNVWNKWDPLRVVMLGNTFAPEYFDGIGGKVETPLKRIQEETLEDLDYYKTVLEDFGAEVIQPEIDSSLRFVDGDGSWQNRRRAPLQPRDTHLVMGNNLIRTGNDNPAIHECLEKYNQGPIAMFNSAQERLLFRTIEEERYRILRGESWPTWEQYSDYDTSLTNFDNEILVEINSYETLVPAPNLTVVGKDLYVDSYVDAYWERFKEFNDHTLPRAMHEAYGDQFRINTLSVGGHNDACFHTVGPGKIITISEIQDYEMTFPGWDIHMVPQHMTLGNREIKPYHDLKVKNSGKWWLPGEENNDEFTKFVNDWLGEWVGFVEETIFDVNVLMLDEHHVCVSNNDNQEINAFFKKHKIEVVHVPWRHRFFHDGGLHCITLDLVRDGVQVDYFPDRTEPIQDKGFDD